MKQLRVFLNWTCQQRDLAMNLFRREIKIWSSFDHPFILPFHGYAIIDESRLFLVSSWVSNGNIMETLEKYPQTDRSELIMQVAKALEYLHFGRPECSYIHGDLKGDNVLVSDGGNALVCDFGLTRRVEKVATMTATPSGISALGHIRFSAPELFSSDQPTRASDVFAFACLIIQIFTGKQPYSQLTTDLQVLKAVTDGKMPERPRDRESVHAGLSDEWWGLITSCMARQPSLRPTMKTIVQRLTYNGAPVGVEGTVRENGGLTLYLSTPQLYVWDFTAGPSTSSSPPAYRSPDLSTSRISCTPSPSPRPSNSTWTKDFLVPISTHLMPVRAVDLPGRLMNRSRAVASLASVQSDYSAPLKPHIDDSCYRPFKQPHYLKEHQKIRTEEHRRQHKHAEATTVPEPSFSLGVQGGSKGKSRSSSQAPVKRPRSHSTMKISSDSPYGVWRTASSELQLPSIYDTPIPVRDLYSQNSLPSGEALRVGSSSSSGTGLKRSRDSVAVSEYPADVKKRRVAASYDPEQVRYTTLHHPQPRTQW
ncbi:hypothetical protein JAAARDRAFT_434477 [Jaapia argillacea MUCL 33604]|uniref:Protein kinase domain-containing protein n=1 Tax=Jaapia argillacea MUCL 33604 TaxID=933084 RepID=A0A067PQ21_9AGAM|nr:hypothetical protein JAAARDRAFT_434477 [Jaapia argillacea MUCL 33604]